MWKANGRTPETMFADGSHLGWRSGSLYIILKVDHIRTIHSMFVLNWLIGFRVKDLNIFSIGSYVKTKLSHGGNLESPIGKRFTNLVHDHAMIIPAKSQFNWFSGFWQEDFQGFNQSEHVIGPGSLVEFPIYTKNTNLVENHPMNIYGKFSWNLLSGFREEELNVKR
jgi:hypothetical protein